MKLISIFVAPNSEDGLWSIQLDGRTVNEFEKFFDQVNNVAWLHSFFSQNEADLHSGFWGNITIGAAIERTLEEAEEMENSLYDYSEQGFNGKDENLQHVFKPLNNFEYTITTYQKSKTRVRWGWLRLYAIRLAENCYLVTGGSIKLTLDMTRGHLQDELKKLQQAKQFLCESGIDYPEDLNCY